MRFRDAEIELPSWQFSSIDQLCQKGPAFGLLFRQLVHILVVLDSVVVHLNDVVIGLSVG